MVPHTVIVDFAVALLVTSLVSDALAALAEEDDLRIVATWTLVFGTLAACFAGLSGYAALDAAAPTDAALETTLRHRNAGLTTIACFLPVAIWRIAAGGRPPERATTLYWVLSCVGLSALVLTAYLGGAAVFRHGVGVGLGG